MREFEPDTFTAIVTDPPYGLEFMGKGWDRGLPPVEVWREAQYVEIINRRLADATT
jgi:tRNA G10  N-methylase Trm11